MGPHRADTGACAVADAGAGRRGTATGVGDVEQQQPALVTHPDPSRRRTRVPQHVGQGLLQDPVGGGVDGRRYGPQVGIDVDVNGYAAGPDPLGQPPDVVQPWCGAAGPDGLRAAQRVQLGAEALQRLAAGRPHGLHRPAGLLWVAVEYVQRHARLHGDHREPVAHRVVEVLRHPQPLLGHRPAGLLGTHPGGGLAADLHRHPDGERGRCDRGPGDREPQQLVTLQAPRSAPFLHDGSREDHTEVDGRRGNRAARGPLRGDSEDRHGDGQEDRPVRVPGREVDGDRCPVDRQGRTQTAARHERQGGDRHQRVSPEVGRSRRVGLVLAGRRGGEETEHEQGQARPRVEQHAPRSLRSALHAADRSRAKAAGSPAHRRIRRTQACAGRCRASGDDPARRVRPVSRP